MKINLAICVFGAVLAISQFAMPSAARADEGILVPALFHKAGAEGVTSSQLMCECRQVGNATFMGLQQCSQRPATYAVFKESCGILWVRHWLSPVITRESRRLAGEPDAAPPTGNMAPLVAAWKMEHDAITEFFATTDDEAIHKARRQEIVKSRQVLLDVIREIDRNNGIRAARTLEIGAN